jgi:hypothetical protein
MYQRERARDVGWSGFAFYRKIERNDLAENELASLAKLQLEI